MTRAAAGRTDFTGGATIRVSPVVTEGQEAHV